MAPNQDFYPTKPPIPRHDNVVGPVVAAGIVVGTIVAAELPRPLPAKYSQGGLCPGKSDWPPSPYPYLCPGKSDWYG